MTETYDKPPETMLFWKCKQRIPKKKKCGFINNKGNMNCHECRSKRDKGDIALNTLNQIVGILVKVEGAVEHWEHFEPRDTVQEGGTGV